MRTNTKNRRPQRGRDIIPKALLDISPNVILIVSPEGVICEVNRLTCEVLGREESSLVGTSYYALCVDDEPGNIRGLIGECLELGKILHVQSRLRSAANGTIDLDLSFSCYPASRRAKKRYCIIIGRDISEEKKKELDLLRFSTIAHYTLIKSYSLVDISLTLPFDFTRLIIASVIGYFAFHEVPDRWSYIGAAVIIGSAVYIAHREALHKRKNR